MARGSTRTARYWGERAEGQCRHANGADLTAKRYNDDWDWDRVASCDDGYYQTAPVGSFKKNEFGLHDVLGNVWEWTQDCWNESYTGASGSGRAWETGDCGLRVLRGGSWVNSPRNLRTASRSGVTSVYSETTSSDSALPGLWIRSWIFNSLIPGGPGGFSPLEDFFTPYLNREKTAYD